MQKPKLTDAFIVNPKLNNFEIRQLILSDFLLNLYCKKSRIVLQFQQNCNMGSVWFVIKHIVCFKLKDNSFAECEKAKEILMSMKGNVPQLRDIAVGIDFLHSERSYDLILEVVLDDEAALESYQNDPYHCSVVKTHMHAVRESSIAVDYVI